MLPKPELAYFAIADISGYTSFLAGVELDHAQDIIADFMNTVVKGLRPPFRLAKFEGDAAFVYAMVEKVDGSLLQDTIESAYFKFRRRLRDVKQASTCECKACVAMSDLDFKFVVHHGHMVKQKMGGREELAGRDVILVHRLLKNTVSEKVGSRAYALYSDACIQTMAMDPVAQGLVEHRETIDIIGDVKLWLRDLDEAWTKENERTHVEVTQADAYVTWDFDIAASRQTVWEHFTVPGQRQKWWPADAIIENSSNKRRGIGTENREHPSSDLGSAKDYADSCLSGSDKWRNPYRNARRQAQAEGQSLRRSGSSEVQRKHHQGGWKIAAHAGKTADPRLCDRRAVFDCLERAIPDQGGEIKRRLNDGLYAHILAGTLSVSGAGQVSVPCLLSVICVGLSVCRRLSR